MMIKFKFPKFVIFAIYLLGFFILSSPQLVNGYSQIDGNSYYSDTLMIGDSRNATRTLEVNGDINATQILARYIVLNGALIGNWSEVNLTGTSSAGNSNTTLVKMFANRSTLGAVNSPQVDFILTLANGTTVVDEFTYLHDNNTGEWVNPANTVDKDWDTFGYNQDVSSTADIYINYTNYYGDITKDSDVLNYTWEIKDSETRQNLSLRSDCTNTTNPLQFKISSVNATTMIDLSQVRYYCWGTDDEDWILIHNSANVNVDVYEQQLWINGSVFMWRNSSELFIDTDTDTHNTTQEMIDAVNTTGLILNWSVIDLDDYVKKSGDTMTGNLNMSGHNITNVHVLYVSNISGNSPVTIESNVISNANFTANWYFGLFNGTFSGNFDGNFTGTFSGSNEEINQTIDIKIESNNLTFISQYANQTQILNNETIEDVANLSGMIINWSDGLVFQDNINSNESISKFINDTHQDIDTNTYNTTEEILGVANESGYIIDWSNQIIDTDTYNTTEEMIDAVNTTGLLINWTDGLSFNDNINSNESISQFINDTHQDIDTTIPAQDNETIGHFVGDYITTGNGIVWNGSQILATSINGSDINPNSNETLLGMFMNVSGGAFTGDVSLGGNDILYIDELNATNINISGDFMLAGANKKMAIGGEISSSYKLYIPISSSPYISHIQGVDIGDTTGALSSSSNVMIAKTLGAGGGIYSEAGHLVLQPRGSTSNRGIIFLDGGGTENMRIQDGGNVGIGTTSPSKKLVVNGDVEVGNELTVTGGYVNLPFGDNALESFDEYLRINDGGEHSSGVYFGSSAMVGMENTLYIGGYSDATAEIKMTNTGDITADGQIYTELGSVLGDYIGFKENAGTTTSFDMWIGKDNSPNNYFCMGISSTGLANENLCIDTSYNVEVRDGALEVFDGGSGTQNYASTDGELYVEYDIEVDRNTYLGDASSDEFTLADDDPIFTNLQSTGAGTQSFFNVCYNTDDNELYYSTGADTSGNCQGLAQSPFFRILKEDRLIEEIEFSANLNSEDSKGYQTFNLKNWDTSQLAVEIENRKYETDYIDLVEIVLMGTDSAINRTGAIQYYILKTNVTRLDNKDDDTIILNAGDKISLRFSPIPRGFTAFSGILRTYGHYISYTDDFFISKFNTTLYHINDSGRYIQYEYNLSVLDHTDELTFSLDRYYICRDATDRAECEILVNQTRDDKLISKYKSLVRRLNIDINALFDTAIK